ncbi:MAG: LD-carboxypeptidase [Bryobacteraceae bacterium]|nr:LD-carboxypeptidase [Bryobacteraceae bacterium]
MNRRTWMMAAGGAALNAEAAQGLIHPRPLRDGDTVGLITPSAYVASPDLIATAERTVKFFGWQPKFGRNVRAKDGYVGGTVEQRLADLHDMFRDPEVKGVFCIRGGFGAAHLLAGIDYDLIRRNPKIFLGYSDITALHLAIHRMTGLVTFHGPVVLSGFSQYTRGHFRRAMSEAKPLGLLANPVESDALRPAHTVRTIRPGKARGQLVGGNLTLISTTIGSPYEIDTRGRILFLEDVDEQPYSIDRLLTHLKLAGKLDAAAGIVFGECSDCRPREFRPSFESTFSLGEVVDRILGKLRVPVLSGLTIGHTSDQLTLPLGVMTTLDADRGTLTIEEAAAR